ncbi:unnamed protein product [Durusdinium trenchii]|uniref:Poly [ADP-ribose] polymerase n=1 Tax=Durusdinium trenchii TaxID=1381693 RepID=A0ABP0HFJ9_9DINO
MGAGGSVVEGQLVESGDENDTVELCQDRDPGDGAPPGSNGRTLCRDFAKGNCKYGDRCRYSHENGGSPASPSEGTRPCRQFLKGECKYGERCRYSHDPGGAPGDRSHVPCRQFAKGFCAYGDRCRYGHDGQTPRGAVPPPMPSVTEEEKREVLSFEDAVAMLDLAYEDSTQRLSALEGTRVGLTNEVQAMEPEERTKSLGTIWQYAGRGGKGRGRTDRWHEFSANDSAQVEEGYQRWVAAGQPKGKDAPERRAEVHLEGGMDISVDFHLGTQMTVGKHALRRVQRKELPSKAQQSCLPFFENVLSIVGDVCGKLEEVSGQMHAMDIEESQVQQLQSRSKNCIEALRVSITSFVELSLFCGANEQMEKLEAVLGEKNAASLGVSAGGRDMRMQTVLKAVKEAFQIRAYGKALTDGQSPWSHIRLLVPSGKRFYEKIMIQLRLTMVKYRSESLEIKRRHAFMLAGTLLNEYSDEDFQRRFRGELKKLFQEGLSEALRNNMSFGTIKAILFAARAMQLGEWKKDFAPKVSQWLKQRLNSALHSQQPLQTSVELVQSAKDFPDVDGTAVVKSLQGPLVKKCHTAIMSKSITPERVNQVGLFQKILGPSFDEDLFGALKPNYEEHRAMITEWLVAYCEHTGVDLPPYCMNANQKEAFDQLRQAIEAADIEELKKAVISAKTVPDLKSHEELSEEFRKALDILKEKAHLPPGWNLEDLLGTEKMFRKAPVNSDRALQLFQALMTSTHQKRWTRDRKTRGDGEKIADSFEVTRVTEVQNQASWENYHRRREEIVKDCNPPDRDPYAPLSQEQWQEWSGRVMTEALGHEIANACRLSPLDSRCNEFLFFHGVKPQVADLIAENHSDISFASKDGMFGAGLYFAEASSKSDEYCQPNEHDEYPIIIVRVILGRPNYIDAPKPFDDPGRRALEHSCMSGSYHSVIGDRIKVSNTYREMVVYDHFQAYPHFILWYQRK